MNNNVEKKWKLTKKMLIFIHERKLVKNLYKYVD